MKKHIVSALSMALCLGLTAGSAVTVFTEDTKTIDSLKIAFSHMQIPTLSPLLPSRWKIY